MNKKIFGLAFALITSATVFSSLAYSRGDLVKADDPCGSCRANGPAAFTCGQCGRGFSSVKTISEGDEYDVLKFSHEGHWEYKECQHSMTARYYK